jgi:hypothetical protein
VAVSVGKGVSVGSGVGVSVESAVSVGVGVVGMGVMLAVTVSSTGVARGAPPDGVRQAVIANIIVKAKIGIYFEFITSLYI